MSRWIFLSLGLLLVVLLPCLLVVNEYNALGPASVEEIPFHGVHVEAASLGYADYISTWSWARVWIRWDEIEEYPGKYIWKPEFDAGIDLLKDANDSLLLTIITTPEWARQNPLLRCSPPDPAYLDDYADFVNALIERYDPQAVELTNEPEVSEGEIGHLDAWMGCWGPEGEYYAEMLETVYPRIKLVHPDVIVVAGALLMPDNKSEFWVDVLEAGAGDYYDVLSFHSYAYYPLNDYRAISDKVDYLRGIGENAPLWLTETSMLCYDEYTECGQDFQLAQGDFFRYLSGHFREIGLELFMWFTLVNNEWRHSDLVENNQLKPAWYIYASNSTPLGRRWIEGR